MIRFENATVRYPSGTTAVDGLSLEVPTGQLTALVGPSGSGKTTSLRMVNRMIDPTDGAVLIDGQDVRDQDKVQLRRGIGYVIQHAGLFPHRTVLQNIATVPLLTGGNRRGAVAHAKGLMELVGLDQALARRYPGQLSGGQQQRVGVARALASDPPILLMDEPFSAVDPVVRLQLQDELVRIQSQLGKTILFVTHDLDEAVKVADQVAVLDVGGRLAQVAPPATLLAKPADSFVADFVGRDRGYRALSFMSAERLLLHSEDTLVLGTVRAGRRQDESPDWTLVVDADNRPQGWLKTADRGDAGAAGPIRREDLNLGGTLAPLSGSLRQLLDAALSSPSGRGVVVSSDGTLTGTITASEVMQVVERKLAHSGEPRQGSGPLPADAGHLVGGS